MKQTETDTVTHTPKILSDLHESEMRPYLQLQYNCTFLMPQTIVASEMKDGNKRWKP